MVPLCHVFHEPWHHRRVLNVLCCCQISPWVFCESQCLNTLNFWQQGAVQHGLCMEPIQQQAIRWCNATMIGRNVWNNASAALDDPTNQLAWSDTHLNTQYWQTNIYCLSYFFENSSKETKQYLIFSKNIYFLCNFTSL